MSGPSFELEERLLETGADLVLGVDEAGRGALAGPLVVGVCAMFPGGTFAGIDDSKRLSHSRRRELAHRIEQEAATWGLGRASPEEIDHLGIAQALRLAATRATDVALRRLDRRDRSRLYFIVDGPVSFVEGYRSEALVKGDSKCISVAAASILAKVHRDAAMTQAAEQYPAYGFESNKGYGTPAHLRALDALGPSPLHRLSFEPVRRAAARTLWDIRSERRSSWAGP